MKSKKLRWVNICNWGTTCTKILKAVFIVINLSSTHVFAAGAADAIKDDAATAVRTTSRRFASNCAIYIVDEAEMPKDPSATSITFSPKFCASGTLVEVPDPKAPDKSALTVVTVAHIATATAKIKPNYLCVFTNTEGETRICFFRTLVRFDALDDSIGEAFTYYVEKADDHPDLAILTDCMTPDRLLPIKPAQIPVSIDMKEGLDVVIAKSLHAPRFITPDRSGLFIGQCERCGEEKWPHLALPRTIEDRIFSISGFPLEHELVPGNSGTGLLSESSEDGVCLRSICFAVRPAPQKPTEEQMRLLDSTVMDPSKVLYYTEVPESGVENIWYALNSTDIERIQGILFA
jgi:hypothetical protein